MKKISIALAEKTPRWARAYAAARKLSLSELVAECLHEHMRDGQRYEDAMRCYLAKGPFKLGGRRKPYASREEIHSRGRQHRRAQKDLCRR